MLLAGFLFTRSIILRDNNDMNTLCGSLHIIRTEPGIRYRL